jgi:hypothetical protein
VGNTVTAATFSAFVKCPMKAHLLALGERPPQTYISDIEAEISSMYKSMAWRTLHDRGEKGEPGTFRGGERWPPGTSTRLVDCDTTVYDLDLAQGASVGRRARKPPQDSPVVPIHFLTWEKPELADNLLVCFGALALSQATGVRVEAGMLVFGDRCRHRMIRISDYSAQVNRTIHAISTLLPGGQEPPLILNPIVQFVISGRSVAALP